MKKLLLLFLLVSVPALAANTIAYRDKTLQVTSSQINTNTVGGTTPFDIGPFDAVNIQCVWASVTGVQPVFKVQTSNDGTNYDTFSNSTTTTTGSSGSSSFVTMPFTGKSARVYVSTTSTTGTLDCISILK